MIIREAKEKDIDEIIKLHLNSFDKNHFSKAFPVDLLRKYFKKFITLNRFCYVILDETDNKILGYEIAGFQTDKTVSEFTSENFFRLIIVLLLHPEFLVEKTGEAFKKYFGKSFEKKAKCRLFLIAVNDIYKGKGIGKKLILHLEENLRKSGVKLYGLSVRRENKNAIEFYKKTGYVIEFENRKSIYFYKEL